MWFVLVFSLLSTATLSAGGGFVSRGWGGDTKENSLSRKSEIQSLLKSARTKFFPNSEKYPNSWLQRFETLFNKYITIENYLEQLRNEVNEKVKPLPESVSKMIDEKRYEVPSNLNVKINNDQLTALFGSVQGMIDEFYDRCLGKDVEQLLNSLINASTIDDEHKKILESQIRKASDETEKYLPIVENASKQFNYTRYYRKLEEIEPRKVIFMAKIGKPRMLYEKLNKDFDDSYQDIISVFKQMEGFVNKLKDASVNMQVTQTNFMTEWKLLFDGITSKSPDAEKFSSEIVEAALRAALGTDVLKHLTKNVSPAEHERILTEMKSLFIDVTANDIGKLSSHMVGTTQWMTFKTNFLNRLTTKIDLCKTNAKLHEYLGYVKTMYETCFQIEAILKDLNDHIETENFVSIEYISEKVNDELFEVPTFDKCEKIEKERLKLVNTIRSAWRTVLQFCFSIDSKALYNTFEAIPLDSVIKPELLLKTQTTINDIQSYLKQMKIAKNSLNLYRLSRCLQAARDAQNLNLLLELDADSTEQIANKLNSEIETDVIKRANILLIKSIAELNRAVDYIIIAQNKLLRSIGDAFKMDFMKRNDPLSPIKRSAVSFKLSGSAGSEDFDNDLFDKLIAERIQFIPVTCKPTRMALEMLKKIIHLMYDMDDRINVHVNALINDEFQSLSSVPLEEDAFYPDDETLREIKIKRKSLLKSLNNCLDRLRLLCNGDIHRKLMNTVQQINEKNWPNININFDMNDIQLKYDKFKELIHGQLIMEFLNQINGIRTIISNLDNKRISKESYERIDAEIREIIFKLRIAHENLEKRIDEATEIILDTERLVIPLLKRINEKLIENMAILNPQASDHITLRSPQKVSHGTPVKTILKPNARILPDESQHSSYDGSDMDTSKKPDEMNQSRILKMLAELKPLDAVWASVDPMKKSTKAFEQKNPPKGSIKPPVQLEATPKRELIHFETGASSGNSLKGDARSTTGQSSSK